MQTASARATSPTFSSPSASSNSSWCDSSVVGAGACEARSSHSSACGIMSRSRYSLAINHDVPNRSFGARDAVSSAWMQPSMSPAARSASPRLYSFSASPRPERFATCVRMLPKTLSRSASSGAATGAGAAGLLMLSSEMLRSTSTSSDLACTGGREGESKSPRMLSRSIAFALMAKWRSSPRRGAGLGGAFFTGSSATAAAASSCSSSPSSVSAGGSGRGVLEQRSLAQFIAHERRLAAQERRDDAVGLRFAEQRQRPAEAFDVRRVPGLVRDQILGDEPRLARLAGFDIGVGQLRLRAVHRRLEAAIDADLDEPHEGRNVARDAGRELLDHGGGARPVALRDGRFGGELDDTETGLGRRRRRCSHPSCAICSRREASSASSRRTMARPSSKDWPRRRMSATVSSSAGSLPAVSAVRNSAAVARSPLAMKRLASCADSSVLPGLSVAACRSVSSASSACPAGVQRRRNHLKLLDGGRVLASLRVVAGGEVHVHQPFASLVVVGVERGRFVQHVDRLRLPALVGELAGDLLEVAERAGFVSQLDAGAGGGQAAFVVFRIERAEADLRLQRAARVPFALAQLDERIQVRPRVRVASLVAENFGDLHERVLVIRLELEDLLVDGGRLRRPLPHR